MNTEYERFEAWAAEWARTNEVELDLASLVGLYTNTYPGRIGALVTELILIAREWTTAEEVAQQIRDAHPFPFEED